MRSGRFVCHSIILLVCTIKLTAKVNQPISLKLAVMTGPVGRTD